MVVVTENDMYWVVDIIFLFLESSEYVFTSDNVECRVLDIHFLFITLSIDITIILQINLHMYIV